MTEQTKKSIIESLDSFTEAYLIAALWSSTGDNGEPLDSKYSIENISLESLLTAKSDCEKFQKENEELLSKATHDNPEYNDEEMNGHDFWLTRCGHGAGFWDRGHDDDVGDKLTDSCKAFGNVDVLENAGEIDFY